MSRLSRNARLAIVIYLVAAGAYLGASSGRLRRHSDDNHYVWLAHGWLHGRLDLGRAPPHQNDWAQVEHITLTDGKRVRGAYLQGTTEMFRTLEGEIRQIHAADVRQRETKWYVSFPPFPAALMLPLVAVFGLEMNDVLFTALLAAFAAPIFFLLLRRLRARGDTERSESDDLWLTALLGVGSVFYYSSVLGQVWYTAHVASVVLMCLYAHFALDARRPILAGLCVVCGFLCRPEILFAAPLFLWELVRVNLKPAAEDSSATGIRSLWARVDRRAVLRGLVLFGLPIAFLGIGAAVLNVLRFGRLTEFGHTYLNVKWTARIQKFGLFNYAFFGRNLACMLALTPRIVRGAPWVQVSWHGLAMWVTTPALLWVLWPKEKGPLHKPLWITTACVALPSLLYQNSGWVQFGYRFSLDYIVFLLMLVAIGDRRFNRWWKVLVVVGIGVNLFGAITFGRMWQFYFDSYFPPGID